VKNGIFAAKSTGHGFSLPRYVKAMHLRAERFRGFTGTGEAAQFSTLAGAEEFLRRVADGAAVGWFLALVDVPADFALPTFHTREHFIREGSTRGKMFPESLPRS